MIYRTLLFALMMGVLSCSDDDGVIDTGPNGFPLDYTYTVSIRCYCTSSYAGPHRIKVEDGVIVDYDFQGDGEGWPDDNRTILRLDELHNAAEKIISEGPATQMVTRDPNSGFITSCYFDIDLGIADEEWGYEVTDLIIR